MNVPEKLINFRAYMDGDDLIGVTDVTLPNLEPMTETVKGAGVAGEVDSPVLGHYGSLEVELNWRTLYKAPAEIFTPKGITLDLRGANQIWDSSAGEWEVQSVKVVVQGMPKGLDLGKLDVGTTSDTSTTLEVVYLKLTVDSKDIIEIDKYNFIDKRSGTDYLSDVKTALGIS